MAVYAYRPGTVFDWHTHREEKCDGVVEDVLRVQVEGGGFFELRPGDRLYLSSRVKHRAEVAEAETVIALDGTKR